MFAKNEYKSYILIDFSKTTDSIRDCFDDIGNLNMFFLRLQAETGVTLYELIDSKTILPCYNSTDPRVSLADTKDFDSYKLYLADTGLFVTSMFIDRPITENDVYAKSLSDKLPASLGFLRVYSA